MKKTIIMAFTFMLLASLVSATTTTLSDAELSMNYVDSRVVEFCLDNANGQQNISVVIDPICRDQNNMYGCNNGDDYNVGSYFTVTPSQNTINDGDCINLTLATTIANAEDGGQFYYTVNGRVGGTTIGSETGNIFVPEFGVLASLAVLAGASVYMYKKRQ